MKLSKPSRLNIAFALHLVFFGLVVTGVLPRSLVLSETIFIAAYLAMVPVQEGILFFVRCIPLLLAIPLTANFDNFNQWRIFSIILFLKWFFVPATFTYLKSELKLFLHKPWEDIKKHPVAWAFKVLGLLAILSLWHAPDRVAGAKRVLYFVNASFIGIVVWQFSQVKDYARRIIRNIAIPTIIVALVGVVQVASTYLMDIYAFMRIWGEGIQLRQFGTQWSYIATHVGNTWFAYFGDQLSLRVFSLFPDSHSFPIFLLLGLPAIFAIAVVRPLSQSQSFKKMLHTRGSLHVLWVPLIFLMVILSGTRGMWLGGAAAIVWAFLVWWFMRIKNESLDLRRVFVYLSSFLALFVLLFAVAYPIFSSPQFLVSKPDALLLQHRLRSVLDFGETSNAARIAIWKSSFISIEHNPALGVGIGNFPVVLGQNIQLTRAGSSAHNLYIHIAAEMGLPAFIVMLYLLWLIFAALYKNYTRAETPFDRAYAGTALITLPWIFAYLMTDVAIFDERALLLFAVTLGLLFRD